MPRSSPLQYRPARVAASCGIPRRLRPLDSRPGSQRNLLPDMTNFPSATDVIHEARVTMRTQLVRQPHFGILPGRQERGRPRP
jgi:hypothetical protein